LISIRKTEIIKDDEILIIELVSRILEEDHVVEIMNDAERESANNLTCSRALYY